MSFPATLHRYFSIIKKLQAKPYTTMNELINHVENKLEHYREKDGKAAAGTAKRTLQRDFKAIHNLFGISIKHCKRNKGYSIAESGIKDHFLQQMADSFATLQMLNLVQEVHAYVHPQKQQLKGKDYFGIILSAIQDKKQVEFTYHKHWDEDATDRILEPYQLREALNRWYVIGKNGGRIKTFALDRISNLLITNTTFTPPADQSYADLYQHTFGIDGPHHEEDEVHDIILSFDPYQGKYVKDLPLHYSQQEIIADEQELRISLRLYITRDLEMQILSYGEKVKVLQPKMLADRMKHELQTTLKAYRKQTEET